MFLGENLKKIFAKMANENNTAIDKNFNKSKTRI